MSTLNVHDKFVVSRAGKNYSLSFQQLIDSLENALNIPTPGGGDIPSGSVMLFYQASAPLGWTQLKDANLNNRGIRLVNGTGGTLSGTVDWSSIFDDHMLSINGNTTTSGGSSFNSGSASGATGTTSSETTNGRIESHALTIEEIPSHNHDIHDPTHKHMIQTVDAARTSSGGSISSVEYTKSPKKVSLSSCSVLTTHTVGGNEGHTHGFIGDTHSHSVSIPSHTHSISVPNHSHAFTGNTSLNMNLKYINVILARKD